jgi:hypothetical protein
VIAIRVLMRVQVRRVVAVRRVLVLRVPVVVVMNRALRVSQFMQARNEREVTPPPQNPPKSKRSRESNWKRNLYPN